MDSWFEWIYEDFRAWSVEWRKSGSANCILKIDNKKESEVGGTRTVSHPGRHISWPIDRNLEVLSLTPCFSWVRRWHRRQNRFNGLQQSVETVETVPNFFDTVFTQLKQGVNERTSKLRSIGHEICGP